MAHLYRILRPRSPKEEGLYTELGLSFLSLSGDTLLRRNDDVELAYNELISTPPSVETASYHLASNSEILGSYRYSELQSNPALLEACTYVWTEGYSHWHEVSYFPEIVALLPHEEAREEVVSPPPVPPFAKGIPETKKSFSSFEEKSRPKNTLEHFVYCIKNFATFDGRASRSEFWSFMLFYAIGWLIINTLLGVGADLFSLINGMWFIGIDLIEALEDLDIVFDGFFLANPFTTVMSGVLGIYSLVMLLPMLAVTSRRLHDSNKSALFLFFLLIPVGGLILLFIFSLLPSSPFDNRYGPIPRDRVPL